ncbi:MAG: adenylyltransferase/cytidyltransferase family protein [Prochlorococcus marinus CUG1431]|uniref:Adenylyltransferase/cytidyltransferase family protein n=1 Tax=Prochlorococcus marinus CUG1433 TaxID=2774506 RepID=A0A9D9BWQ0_PROMR|nr:adenylyltransferase/cytidyltransferase family protein [Prochlorococcus marinus CUG1433]MBO6981224.1 adenylyltransferase/cytidyltransferase family protein [Prochlorococcus marinus CUG1431]
MIIGYTAGVFDLFHVGHVNMLKTARGLCDKLIVAVTSDELVAYKNKKPVICFEDRKAVVESCKYVDIVIGQYDLDKYKAYLKIKFDLLFVGDDWYGKDQWRDLEEKISPAKIIFIPYTRSVSSTKINSILEENRFD